MPILNLFEESYQMNERAQANQQCTNFFFESYENGQKTKTPTAISTVLGAANQAFINSNLDITATCRGLYWSSTGPAPDYNSRLYGVWGTSVYRFDTNILAAALIGNVVNYGYPCCMTDNGNAGDFLITDGIGAYTAKMSAIDGYMTLAPVALPIVPGSAGYRNPGTTIKPSMCAFLGQRLIINAVGTPYYFYSNLFDVVLGTGGTVFTSRNFLSDESSGDMILAIKVVSGSLVTLGQRSYSIWRVTSNQGMPFSMVSGTSNAIGVEAPWSVAALDDNLFWLASSDVGSLGVYMLKGTALKRISTQGIDETLMNYTNRDQAIGCAYSYKGNFFYCLTFASNGNTIVYDSSCDKWHYRRWRNLASGTWDAWRYLFVTGANGKLFAGVGKDGSALVELRDDRYLEWDNSQIFREGVSKVLFDDMVPMNLQELTMDVQVGDTDILTGTGSDPVIMLQLSKDQGRTWGNVSERKMGKQGEYLRRVSWTDLGTSTYWAFRVVVTDPVPCTISQVKIRYTKGKV